jgi:alpha-amylase/alpha-mannosidase (GH57 family)
VKKYLCIHGHFYQPPRENPWFDTIEVQDSAYPFHDWNERVTAECYAPNAASRILDNKGRIVNIVNNYSRMSFNFGPTLLSWLEDREPEVYAAILDADRLSRARFSGHGSAMAQAYNHMIMPLATKRDKVTQVLWGLADFRRRFGREPEGMWLPETAVDVEALEVLASCGLAFTVLAPHQAGRVRKRGDRAWQDVTGARVDPSRAYEARLPSGRRLALFFYDGPISQAVAFERLLSSGATFLERLSSGFSDARGWDQLMHIATDGETYGHHHRFGDMALAWVLDRVEREKAFRLTNYGELLESHPPTHEVEILPNTSWSCAHGVERWRSDCGCSTGSHVGWRQTWRGPLRRALDWLAEALAPVFEERAGALLKDPWAARDAFIDVVLDRSDFSVDSFLTRYGARPHTAAERQTVLELLEMQRHLMLMYTSCGWFFDDISGIETVQVLQYAGRAIQLGQKLTAESLEPQFLTMLAEARSNVVEHDNGAAIYQRLVKPAMADLRAVAAHHVLGLLFNGRETRASEYGHRIEVGDLRRLDAGRARLALGRLAVTSQVTGESADLCFGVLHLGDHNLTGGVRTSDGEAPYHGMIGEVTTAFSRGDLPAVLRLLDRYFELTYSLKSLIRDEQRRILATVLDSTLAETAQTYRKLYDSQAPLMRFLGDLKAPLPRVLKSTAEFVLNTELRHALAAEGLPLDRIHGLLDEARHFGIALDGEGLGFVLGRSLARLAVGLKANPRELKVLQALTGAVGIAVLLPFDVEVSLVQNAYFNLDPALVAASRTAAEEGDSAAQDWLTCHQVLGELLHVQPPAAQS